MKNNLDKNLLDFLSSKKIFSSELITLQSDASKRKYYRSKIKNNSFLVMDSSDEKMSLRNFIKISNWLRKNSYSSPAIFHKEMSKGFCVLEDFGNNKFSDLKKNNIRDQYNLTIKLLKSLSKQKPPQFLNSYSREVFRQELNIFIDWYLFYKKKKKSIAISIWNEIWESLFLKTNNNNKSIVLRDFHIDNLFWLKNRSGLRKIGLIDFQDALIGHPCYDLVSLLQDVRVNISDKEQYRLFNNYLSDSNFDKKLFEESYFIFGTQRLIKIIGVFYRLKFLHKKNNYMSFIPRTWSLLKKNLKYPLLKDLSNWFKDYVF